MGRLALPLLAALTVAVPAAESRSSVFVTFKTPSGNIGCIYSSSPSYLRCDIRSGLRNPPAKRPAGCDLDWGFAVGMTKTGRAAVLCHGDTALDPRARALGYGTDFVRDGFRCQSRDVGLRCTNARGRGWFLSREGWFVF